MRKKSFSIIRTWLMIVCMLAGMLGMPITVYGSELDDAAIVAADKEALVIGFSAGDSADSVTGNLTLVTTGDSLSSIVWISDTPEVIAHDGAVTRPAADAEDAEVTLTATITYGAASDTKEFTVTVLKESGLQMLMEPMSELEWGPGDGLSADTAFRVSSAEHLAAIPTKSLTAHYVQTTDLDLAEAGYTNWTPIGGLHNQFTGTYNGGGYTISNLTIETDTVNLVGLFGVVGDSGKLDNIRLENANIHATHTTGVSTDVGSLAGYNRGTVSNCEVEAEVIGGKFAYVGGLTGSNQGFISQSHSTATVGGKESTMLGGLTGTNSGSLGRGVIDQCSSGGSVSVEDPPNVGPRMGGSVGSMADGAVIKTSFSTASVSLQSASAPVSMGGLVGECYGTNSTITGCYSTGDVVNLSTFSISYTGGLVGYFYGGPVVEKCYSTGDITGLRRVGGISGGMQGSVLKNCYSTGMISGAQGVGGISGSNTSGLIENCYSTSPVTGSTQDVGGIVGFTNNIVKNTTALNSFVNGGSNTGRIVGRVNVGADISGNTAWAFMLVNGDVSIAGGAEDHNNGVSLRYVQLCREETWMPLIQAKDGSGNNIWNYTEGNLPVLSNMGGPQSASFPQYLVGYELISINPVNNITVPYGTTLSEALAALPGTTAVEDGNGQMHTAALNWTIASYTGDTPGDYTATGTFDLPMGVEQTIPATELKVTAIVTVLQVVTYNLTITAGTGGRITSGTDGSYAKDTVINIAAVPDANYRFSGWTSTSGGTFGNANDEVTTFVMPASTATITANFSYTGSSSGSSYSGGITPAPTPTVDANGNISAPSRLDQSTGMAVAGIDDSTLDTALSRAREDSDGQKRIEIAMSVAAGAGGYELTLPAGALSSGTNTRLAIRTNIADVTLPGNMLAQADAQTVALTIAQADISGIDAETRNRIGGRPVIQLSLAIDGKQTAWDNPGAPVAVSIPYTPTAAELADPEHITVWYIDEAGNMVEVPSGRYDPVTGRVNFSTTHFSDYAVVYVQKTFSDLGSVEWARKSIEVLASKGVLRGIAEAKYEPQTHITRADFLYFLVRTLGVDARVKGNFDDIGRDAYYYEEIGIAKALGITGGTGNNRFTPDEGISRQDMMVLTERALRMLDRLEVQGSAADLERFSDKPQVAGYAVNSVASVVKAGLIVGSGDRIDPLGHTNRAEAAVFLYRIYNR